MRFLRTILMILVLGAALTTSAQAFNRTYNGWWASTHWAFNFKSNGTFSRISTGHYGNTTVNGRYKINKDTIQILAGFNETSGTINEKYLIDSDSLIIDLELYYDYRIETAEQNFYTSKKRYDILAKPNMDSMVILSKAQFDTIVRDCIALLETHPTIQLKDKDNSTIIRLINTINMNRYYLDKNEIYAKFIEVVKSKGYEKDIAIYYDWVPNRGMGYYFQKLQIELGGTPHLYSQYTLE